MKGMYGLEVLSKLRELDPRARVIVLSADIQTSSRQMVNDAGAAAFLNKPVAADDLLNAVAAALAQEA
jgi:two-component system chemotaxis response regulator CheY